MANFKAGQFIGQNATGEQTITGIGGYTPALTLVSGAATTANGGSTGSRFQLGAGQSATKRLSASMRSVNAVNTSNTAEDFRSDYFNAIPGGTTDTNLDRFDFVSHGADELKIDWAVASAEIVNYLTISDVHQIGIGTFDLDGSLGVKTFSGIVDQTDASFRAKLVLFFTSTKTTAEGAAAEALMMFGAMDGTGGQACMFGLDRDGLGTSDSSRITSNDCCIQQTSTSEDTLKAAAVSIADGEFSINVLTGLACRIGYVAIGGPLFAAKVLPFSAPINAADTRYAGIPFTPEGAIFFGGGGAFNTISAAMSIALGFASSTSEIATLSAAANDNNGVAGSADDIRNGSIIRRISATGIDQCIMNLNAFESGGFRIQTTTVDSNGAYVCVAMGTPRQSLLYNPQPFAPFLVR